MKPPRRRLTTRAMIVLTAMFALDFGGIAWLLRPETRDTLARANPDFALLSAFFLLFATIGLVFASIYLYVPRPLDEALMVLLIVAITLAVIILALQHSRSKAPPPPQPGGVGRPGG